VDGSRLRVETINLWSSSPSRLSDLWVSLQMGVVFALQLILYTLKFHMSRSLRPRRHIEPASTPRPNRSASPLSHSELAIDARDLSLRLIGKELPSPVESDATDSMLFWGLFLVLSASCLFVVGLYAVLLSSYMPQSGYLVRRHNLDGGQTKADI
jgi:hypothetical protein